MTDDGGYNFQVSIKFGSRGEGMINVRASSPEELTAWTEVAEQMAGPLMDLTTAYNPPASESEAISNLAAGGITGEAYQGRTCAHGTMVYKTGGSGPKQWSAWMCPAPQGDPTKCQPIDAKTGRPWPRR